MKNQEFSKTLSQYKAIKIKHPDAILLFEIGDYFEGYNEDAIKLSKTTGLVLTKRLLGENSIPLSGFHVNSLENYLPKLVKSGFRVALCKPLD